MKYKKYLFITILIVLLGCIKCDKLLAAETEEKYCYYLTDDRQTSVRYKKTNYKFYIDQRGENFVTSFNDEPLINRTETKEDKILPTIVRNVTMTGITVNKISNPNGCPNYIVYRRYCVLSGICSDGIYGFDDENDAKEFKNASEQIPAKNDSRGEISVWLLRKGNGTRDYTEEDYFGAMVPVNIGGDPADVDCNALFGNKDDDNSLAYLIDSVLKYVRIIVPILLILLGALDIGKAVIASREEEMRKAQSALIKRTIAAICVFLAPVFVNIVMNLADIVWQGEDYSYCTVMSYKEK